MSKPGRLNRYLLYVDFSTFEMDRTGFAMLSSYFTENSLSQLWNPTPVMYQNVRRSCVKVLQLLFDSHNGNVIKLCKNSKYEIL